MSADRELLELAAKAAGIAPEDGGPVVVYEGKGVWINEERFWNPLTDDGDALRLALAVPGCFVIDNDMRWCGFHRRGERGKYDMVGEYGNDPAAATRRAIVRAAAEIGRSMD